MHNVLWQNSRKEEIKMKKYNVAVVGATGLVGRTIIEVLEERKFPISNLYAIASERSSGKITIPYAGTKLPVESLKKFNFSHCDIALFSAGKRISLEYGPIASFDGCVVIDNSSAWRMHKKTALVVPEINPHDILKYWNTNKTNNLIANPNCSTIQLVMVLKPILNATKLKRVVVSTYQSVSGTGYEAIEELLEQTNITSGINTTNFIKPKQYPHQIAFNCLPHIDAFIESGYTKEEMKIINETRKILGIPNLPITATTVRVPVLRGHSESVNIETEEKLTAKDARLLLSNMPGVVVLDKPSKNIYPMPINTEYKDDVFVGRIREDESIENGINLWIVSDNLRKGAATNAVQIAEYLISNSNFKYS